MNSGDRPRAAAHGEGSGGAGHLVKMANDIGDFFRAEPQREDAIAGIANHIAKFWTKRMRAKLHSHLEQDGASRCTKSRHKRSHPAVMRANKARLIPAGLRKEASINRLV